MQTSRQKLFKKLKCKIVKIIGFLRKFRIFIAIIVFATISFSFLDIYHIIPDKIFSWIVSWQFIPSVINFLKASVFIISSFLVVAVLTLLIGRVYCSTLCPFGIMMDIMLFFKRKFKKKKIRFKYIKPLYVLPYSILAISILLLFFGSIQLLSFLDPYSNFGRIATLIAKPMVTLINNLGYDALIKFNNYTIQPIAYNMSNIPVSVFVILMLAAITFYTLKKGRVFCSHICPVGSLLGLISRHSLVKIEINESECISCGACEFKCKMGCISAKDRIVDTSRCVMCLNCINVKCPNGAINLSISSLKKKKEKTQVLHVHKMEIEESKQDNFKNSRRDSIKSMALLPILLAGGAQKTMAGIINPDNSNKKEKFKKRQIPISPPGSLNFNHFTDSCTACYLCVNACPSNVIKPSVIEYGSKGAFLPQLTNELGYCNFECVRCTNVCPSGALLPVSMKEKKTLQIGIAHFVRELCVVITDKTDCGACSEHCPTKAVNMVLENGLFVPVVQEEICVGCGACEYACPVTPNKAIFVEGNQIHQIADKPTAKKLDEVDMEEDFPF